VKSKKAKIEETEIKTENESSDEITQKSPSPAKTPKTAAAKSKKEPKPVVEKPKKEPKPKAEKAKKEPKATTPKAGKAKKEPKSSEKTPKQEPKSAEKSPKKEPKSAEKSPKTMGNCCSPDAEGKTPGKDSEESKSLLAAVTVDEKDYSEVVKRARYDPIDDAMWKKGAKTPYLAFAKTLQAIEATSGRLKTIEILANYFRFGKLL